jgi:2-hydroxychromene-2-carboxylate isomerase
MPAIDFWFDFASTYSYLAAMRIAGAARQAHVAVSWRAFLLGPIFAAKGLPDSPFNLDPVKGAYMWRDLERLAAKQGLAWRRPSVFPRDSIPAGRIAAAFQDELWLPAFVRTVFQLNFVHDQDIASRAALEEAVAAAGGPADAAMRALEEPLKGALRAATAEAIAKGVFGAPSFTIDQKVGETEAGAKPSCELFWGGDRMEDALLFAAQR